VAWPSGRGFPWIFSYLSELITNFVTACICRREYSLSTGNTQILYHAVDNVGDRIVGSNRGLPVDCPNLQKGKMAKQI
jgi:hypothetical protein